MPLSQKLTGVISNPNLADIVLPGQHLQWQIDCRRGELGEQRLELTEYLAPKGRPLPDDSRANELKTYAKANLPTASAPDVAKAVDEIQFRAEFKKRLASQLNAWIAKKTPQ